MKVRYIEVSEIFIVYIMKVYIFFIIICRAKSIVSIFCRYAVYEFRLTGIPNPIYYSSTAHYITSVIIVVYTCYNYNIHF